MTQKSTHISASLVREVVFSGLLVGSLEPCIEDSILFSAGGSLSLSNLPFLIWIGAVELVGVGQILLLSRFFKNGNRLRAAIVLWVLTAPAIFLFFPLGAFLSPYVRLINIWGPFTVFFVATLVVGMPAYLPKTRIPIAYISLIAGLAVDLTLSSTFLRTSVRPPSMALSQVLMSCVVVLTVMGVILFLFSYLSDRIYVKAKEEMKKKIEKHLRFAATLYLLTMAGFLTGYIPSLVPISTLAVSLLLVIARVRKDLDIHWISYPPSPEILRELASHNVQDW